MSSDVIAITTPTTIPPPEAHREHTGGVSQDGDARKV
jgi:hypothetical protein